MVLEKKINRVCLFIPENQLIPATSPFGTRFFTTLHARVYNVYYPYILYIYICKRIWRALGLPYVCLHVDEGEMLLYTLETLFGKHLTELVIFGLPARAPPLQLTPIDPLSLNRSIHPQALIGAHDRRKRNVIHINCAQYLTRRRNPRSDVILEGAVRFA